MLAGLSRMGVKPAHQPCIHEYSCIHVVFTRGWNTCINTCVQSGGGCVQHVGLGAPGRRSCHITRCAHTQSCGAHLNSVESSQEEAPVEERSAEHSVRRGARSQLLRGDMVKDYLRALLRFKNTINYDDQTSDVAQPWTQRCAAMHVALPRTIIARPEAERSGGARPTWIIHRRRLTRTRCPARRGRGG